MIYIDGTLLNQDVYIESINGLYDFPELKADPVDWDDSELLEFDDSQETWQFKERKIKINCFLVADTYVQAKIKYLAIKDALEYDGLKLLELPAYSNRGYMVYLSDGSFVSTRYENTKSKFRFSLTFTEPQPYNIQFYYDFGTSTALSLEIGKLINGSSQVTEDQKYVNIYFNGSTINKNIYEENYTYSGTLAAGTYKCIIWGNIDEVEKIQSSVTPNYNTIANYYFRNGSIT